MSRSKARMFPGPVLVAREMCDGCHGMRSVPTPEMAGWEAKVERIRLNIKAEHPSEPTAYERAREVAGPPPDPATAPCGACDGDGFKDTELYLDELRAHLAKESE
jgi:hypothetical protein